MQVGEHHRPDLLPWHGGRGWCVGGLVIIPIQNSKVGVNLLGYREPRLVHVMRCQGLCHLGVACVPSSVDRRTITMMLKTSHTGSEARTEKQEVALEEHLACACDCDQQEEQECSGRWE